MADEESPKTQTTRGAQGERGEGGFVKEVGRDVGRHLLQETGTTIRWAVGGALLGAAVLGGLGLWKFGAIGLALGALVGAVAGAVLGGHFYLSA